MANEKLEINGVNFVPFKRGLKHPKMSWLVMMLNKYGIRHAIVGESITGQMFYVEQGNVELCSGILSQELARFIAKTDNFDDGPTMEISVCIDDLPNDHAFFEAQIAGQSLDPVVPSQQVAIPETLMEAEPAGAVIDVEATEVTDEDDDDGWGFDDEDEVVTPAEEKALIDADIEDLDASKEQPPPKKKKSKPEPKEAIDPDFATAEESPIKYTPVTGEEFLRVDTVLSHEEIQFPEVKKPIRMYDTDSATLSAVGCKELAKDPLVVTLYVRFKSGATVYRYNPVAKADFNSLLNEVVRKHEGIQEASAGSFFHWTIKVKAEEGTIKCQRLTDDNKWVDVLPKTQRTKEIKERANNS